MPDRRPRAAPPSPAAAERLARLLAAIEAEPAPERLLELARELQRARSDKD